MPKKTALPRPVRALVNLEFVAQVNSKKTVYYVLRTGEDYLVSSFRDANYRAGNFNLVSHNNIDRILAEFAGEKRVTRKMVQDHPKMKRFFGHFDVLQALYVLVALGKAGIDRRSATSRTLYFNFAALQ